LIILFFGSVILKAREVFFYLDIFYTNRKDLKTKKVEHFCSTFVGVAGFEPAASCSQSRRDNRATLHPESGCKDKTNFEFYKRFYKIECYYFKIVKSDGFLN
jgi:hypothetical protein